MSQGTGVPQRSLRVRKPQARPQPDPEKDEQGKRQVTAETGSQQLYRDQDTGTCQPGEAKAQEAGLSQCRRDAQQAGLAPHPRTLGAQAHARARGCALWPGGGDPEGCPGRSTVPPRLRETRWWGDRRVRHSRPAGQPGLVLVVAQKAEGQSGGAKRRDAAPRSRAQPSVRAANADDGSVAHHCQRGPTPVLVGGGGQGIHPDEVRSSSNPGVWPQLGGHSKSRLDLNCRVGAAPGLQCCADAWPSRQVWLLGPAQRFPAVGLEAGGEHNDALHTGPRVQRSCVTELETAGPEPLDGGANHPLSALVEDTQGSKPDQSHDEQRLTRRDQRPVSAEEVRNAQEHRCCLEGPQGLGQPKGGLGPRFQRAAQLCRHLQHPEHGGGVELRTHGDPLPQPERLGSALVDRDEGTLPLFESTRGRTANPSRQGHEVSRSQRSHVLADLLPVPAKPPAGCLGLDEQALGSQEQPKDQRQPEQRLWIQDSKRKEGENAQDATQVSKSLPTLWCEEQGLEHAPGGKQHGEDCGGTTCPHRPPGSLRRHGGSGESQRDEGIGDLLPAFFDGALGRRFAPEVSSVCHRRRDGEAPRPVPLLDAVNPRRLLQALSRGGPTGHAQSESGLADGLAHAQPLSHSCGRRCPRSRPLLIPRKGQPPWRCCSP